MRGEYNPIFPDPYIPFLPEQRPLGDTLYGSLNTGGVGLNLSSYIQYSGQPSFFNMPARYEFNKLQAIVYGTNVNVSCHNVTSSYGVTQADVDAPAVDVAVISRASGPNFTFLNTLDDPTQLAIGSAVIVNSKSGVPVHTLAIPSGFKSAFVLECTYDGQEYQAEISVNSSTSPLHIDRQTDLGPTLGPLVQQRLANLTSGLLALSNSGGNLAQGFLDAGYNTYADNNTDMATAIETVFGQLGEAYFSVLRQGVERSNMYRSDSDLSAQAGSELRLFVTVQRLGGGLFGWLAVLAVLLVGSVMGLVQVCIGSSAVDFDAQDAVKLLRETLHSSDIRDKTRVKYRDGIVIPGLGNMRRASMVESDTLHKPKG